MKKHYQLYNVQPFSSITEMIEIAVREAGNKIAYKYKHNDTVCDVTFSQFAEVVSDLCAFLKKKGLYDRHIACIGANSYEWITAYFAVLNSDGVFVPIDKDLPTKDIIGILKDSEASAVFCDKAYEEIFRSNADAIKNIECFIVFDRDADEENFISYRSALETGRNTAHDFPTHADNPEKMKLLVYTSGTTGKAKGVMLSEKNLVSSVYYGLMVSTVYDMGLSILPYHHTYEAVSDILVSFHHHSTLCINESLSAIMKNLTLYKPSYVYIVPAIAESIFRKIMRTVNKEIGTEKFSFLVEKSNSLRRQGIDKRREYFSFIHEALGGRLRKIVCGGAPVRPEVAKFFEDVGFDFINGYGITECSPLVSVNHDNYNDINTVGIKLPCIEWRIDNPNDEGIGEICIRGDIVMLGYYKQPQLTSEVIKNGWFYTGDYGYINEKEQLTICGRKKNMIVLSNGKNVYPEEIEEQIRSISYINEVIVRSEKDSHGNEKTLTAEVYLEEKKTPAEILYNIKNACVGLPVYKQVSKVIVRDNEFPKTSSNKIIRI